MANLNKNISVGEATNIPSTKQSL